MKLRVAVVASSDSPGGAEEYLYRLYALLSETGRVSATLVGSLPGWHKGLGSHTSVSVTTKLTRQKRVGQQIVGAVRNTVESVLSIRRGQFDVLHMQYFLPKLVLPALLHKKYSIVWTEHGPLPPNLGRVGEILYKYQSRFARVISVSEAVARSLESFGVESEVIENPLPLMTESLQPAGRDSVLYVGRLHSSKRVELILDAAEQLPHTPFLVVGDGPHRQTLEMRAPPNIDFVGHTEKVTDYLYGAKCLVLSSGEAAREGSPMAMLEARALGLPVLVASDSHAAGEAEGLGCRLYEPSPVALIQRLKGLADDSVDMLDLNTIEARSERRWAERHLRIMEQSAHHQVSDL